MHIRTLPLRRYFIRGVMTESVPEALEKVRQNIRKSHEEFCENSGGDTKKEPVLVAVSKTKPNYMIIEAYKSGQKDFGENYVQELIQKANFFHEQAGYQDIRWHFIGHLQRNKVNNLLGAPNLHSVQTVDSEKLANALDKSWQKLRGEREKLKVFAQINTSGEVNKSGEKPERCVELVKHIIEKCGNLQLEGLMTIGAFNHDYSQGPNPDFICLTECRKEVSTKLGIDEHEIALSMGMSNDYQHAIMCGSTYVRVGSTIFGARDKKRVDGNAKKSVDESDVTEKNIDLNELKIT